MSIGEKEIAGIKARLEKIEAQLGFLFRSLGSKEPSPLFG